MQCVNNTTCYWHRNWLKKLANKSCGIMASIRSEKWRYGCVSHNGCTPALFCCCNSWTGAIKGRTTNCQASRRWAGQIVQKPRSRERSASVDRWGDGKSSRSEGNKDRASSEGFAFSEGGHGQTLVWQRRRTAEHAVWCRRLSLCCILINTLHFIYFLYFS